MWYAIYDTTTRELRSVGTVIAQPLPDGLSSKSYATMQSGHWNPATLDFEEVVEPAVLLPEDFMGLFTFAEEAAIRAVAKIDVDMETFLARAQRARKVAMNHPDTVNGVGYCVAKGCITAQRAGEILNG